MARRKSKPKFRKFKKSLSKFFRAKLGFFIKTSLVLLLILAGFIYKTYQDVNNHFVVPKPQVPSLIYSDALTLFPGKNLSQDLFKEKLTALGYQQVDESPSRPGEFAIHKNSIRIFLNSFQYPHETQKPFLTQITWNGSRLNHLEDSKGKKLDFIRLEPEIIGSITDASLKHRTFLPLKDISPLLVDAVLLTEDERFYSHFGIDPLGILRASLVNLTHGKWLQGGSTLTQQLAKNVYLTHERTLSRKVREALMAFVLESKFSKTKILELYLNEIYLGQNGPHSVMGIEQAARFYFNKPARLLNAAESALIAGLISSPGSYSPIRFPDKAKARRDFILNKMQAAGKISAADLKTALAAPLPKKTFFASAKANYFIEFVKQELRQRFSEELLSTEGLKIFTTLDMTLQRSGEKNLAEGIQNLETNFPVLKAQAAKGKHLQGALIALEPGTGFVKAYVGGNNYAVVQFDHLRQAKRQPGSTFKPFVYLTALAGGHGGKNYTLATPIDDSPLSLTVGGKKWQPMNYDRKNHGLVRLRTALENSFNICTTRLALDVGVPKIIENAKAAGIKSKMDPYPSVVLGAFELTPLELATAYTVFPGEGARAEPVTIRRVVTPGGKVLEQQSVDVTMVFRADTIYLMNQILKGVVDHGTAAGARRLGFSGIAAGKTGTTQKSRDSWFVGYTSDLLALTWIGFDDNTSTGLTGASGALPIWTRFMIHAGQAENKNDFTPTRNIVKARIDSQTGSLYDGDCDGSALEEEFIRGTEPEQTCDKFIEDTDLASREEE